MAAGPTGPTAVSSNRTHPTTPRRVRSYVRSGVLLGGRKADRGERSVERCHPSARAIALFERRSSTRTIAPLERSKSRRRTPFFARRVTRPRGVVPTVERPTATVAPRDGLSPSPRRRARAPSRASGGFGRSTATKFELALDEPAKPGRRRPSSRIDRSPRPPLFEGAKSSAADERRDGYKPTYRSGLLALVSGFVPTSWDRNAVSRKCWFTVESAGDLPFPPRCKPIPQNQ